VARDLEAVVAQTYQDEWARIVASLIRKFGDWDLAEECTQEAFAQALGSWRESGAPRNPGAWVTTVARNRALDRLRRRASETRKLEESARMSQPAPEEPEDESGISDDRLRLMFTCCHPALSMEARAALTLRSIAGLTTAEIARAFLVSEQTMAKRLVRAKSRIQAAGIPYRVPPRELLDERTSGVLAVLYLLFTEGYASAGERFLRDNLCAEAIRLARLLTELMPDQPEAQGLLALMLLQHSRRRARVDEQGALVPLESQDRDLWDAAEIDEAITLLEQTDPEGHDRPYQLQAAIAVCHATARTPADTDWPAIATLYGQLTIVAPSPIVRLNHAVACGMADGPGVGLALLAEIEDSGALNGYYLVPATRADLLRRLGRFAEAAVGYREALPLAPAEAERRYLRERLASVEASVQE
jgi:RNA polymerase sigma-70 factor (ECF subfamily)